MPVLDYDLKGLLRNGVFRVSSPNFTRPFVVGQALVVLALSVWVAWMCSSSAPVKDHHAHHDHPMHDSSNHDHHHMAAIAGAVHGYFGVVTAFLFSYFLFHGVHGNMAIRGKLGGLLGGLSTLLFLTHGWVPGSGGEDLAFKRTVLRWGMASYVLTAYAAAHGQVVGRGKRSLRASSGSRSLWRAGMLAWHAGARSAGL